MQEKITFEQACSSFDASGQTKAAFAYFCKSRNKLKKSNTLEAWKFEFETFKNRDNHKGS